jgi:hypothetical protein
MAEEWCRQEFSARTGVGGGDSAPRGSACLAKEDRVNFAQAL